MNCKDSQRRIRSRAIEVAALLALCALNGLAGPVRADKSLEGIACRSVHLGYPAAKGDAFYNEIEVKESAPGTYFCVCGFSRGYYGIQELGNGKKLLIFSVWDPGNQNDPNKVDAKDRVRLLHRHEKVRIGRFGNEGTGGQSFFDYPWKIGQTYRFLVRAEKDGDNRTAYSGYFYHPEEKQWLHLVTFSTITRDPLQGYYSFVEDFRRNRVSATQPRQAIFGAGWVRKQDGTWQELARARFTADSNPVLNINAKRLGERFLLATGGTTRNADARLLSYIERPAGKLPSDLPGSNVK